MVSEESVGQHFVLLGAVRKSVNRAAEISGLCPRTGQTPLAEAINQAVPGAEAPLAVQTFDQRAPSPLAG